MAHSDAKGVHTLMRICTDVARCTGVNETNNADSLCKLPAFCGQAQRGSAASAHSALMQKVRIVPTMVAGHLFVIGDRCSGPGDGCHIITIVCSRAVH